MLSELPTVLVVEDDEVIQLLAEDALQQGGFEIAVAATGEEAVTLLQGGVIKYRALVVDINLLGKFDGWQVARAARKSDPNFPVIYMSGVASEQWPIQGVPNSLLLQKPFAPVQLVTAVAQLLNASPPAGSDV
jgi:DNA-binding response OmpR family regulator